MKIIKLTLHLYKRFDLLGADTLTYTPESPYQLILGKNGIGKSSLLNELSPLPCETTDLKENGYKEIEIEHRGHKYILRNTLQKKLNNSFIRDGVELNQGGTTRAQKDLVEEHFNYTSQLHDILMDITLFSNMTPQVRREWFIKMSHSDMTYAISLFNRIKSAERDIKGAIKINNNRIVQEQAKLPPSETIVYLKEQNQDYINELNQILPHLDKEAQNVSNQLLETSQQLIKVSENIADCGFEMVFEGISKYPVLVELRQTLDFEYNRNRQDYEKVIQELSEVQDIIHKANTENKRPISEIDRDINYLDNELQSANQIIAESGIKVSQDNYQEKLHFAEMKQDLMNILSHLPSNPMVDGERKYTRAKYDKIRLEVDQHKSELIKNTNEVSYLKRELEQMKSVHDIDCPNCHHRFKPGIDCTRIERYENKINHFNKLIEEQMKTLDELQTLQDEFTEWGRWVRALRQLPERYPVSVSLLDYLYKLDLLNDNPKLVIQKINEYERIVDMAQKKIEIESYLVKLDQERTKTLASEGNDMEFVYTTLKKLETESEALQKQLHELEDKLKKIRMIISNHEQIRGWEQQVRAYIEQMRNDTLMQVRYKNNLYLENIVSELQQSLADNQQYLNTINQSETIIEQLEITQQQLKEEQESLAILTTILSPQDGLIAESLLGFMNQYLDDMCNILDQIWTYSMRPYLDLGEDGIELDYRFPVDVNEGDIYVKDVYYLSRGQKEIVNFTFKLLLMQYLDLSDYPLIMDEIGGSFDNLHRDRLYRYIKLLVESNQVQQVFIISHIASSHDALSNADRCVLDTDATMIDKNVNKVLQFN